MSGEVDAHNEKKVDVKVWGSRDSASEGITEGVCIFLWLTEVCH